MKKVILILAVIFSVYACKNDAKKTDENPSEKVETIRDVPKLALSEFDSEAGKYVNKEVLVQGIVDHVCKHGGKKLLLVTDDGDVHVTSNERFDETLKGNEIVLKGIVLEERIDESYCLKMEEDNIKSHSEGKSSDEQFEARKDHIQQYRDQMKTENKEYISLYSLDYVSHSVLEE